MAGVLDREGSRLVITLCLRAVCGLTTTTWGDPVSSGHLR